MGLITEKVIMKWNGRTAKYYKEKGYIFTKWYDEFEIKVKDLSNGSNLSVDIECDCCNKILKNVQWYKYINSIKNDGKYYCQKCSMKLYSTKNMVKTKLLRGKSLEQWCIENKREDILTRWDYELNECSPSDICYSANGKDKKGYWFKCERNIHPSELKIIHIYNTKDSVISKCSKCNSFAQWGIDNICSDFLEKYWSNKNILNPWEIGHSSNKKIYIICQEKEYHEDYPATSGSFIRKVRCSNFHGKVHLLDSLGTLFPESLKYWSNKNIKTPFEYTPKTKQKVWWKCPDGKHKDFYRGIGDSNACDFRCVDCTRERDESMLQEKTRLYLNELGYQVLHENKCTLNPKNIVVPPNNRRTKKLRYDNEIIVKGVHFLIEVNGGQHYIINTWHEHIAKKYNTTPQQELDYQIAKDKYKKEYSISNGYEYLAIPYWEFDKNDIYKSSIYNKIQEILNKSICNNIK